MKYNETIAELRQLVDNNLQKKYPKRTIYRGIRDISIVRDSFIIDYVSLVKDKSYSIDYIVIMDVDQQTAQIAKLTSTVKISL